MTISSGRRAILAWVLGGVVAGYAVMPICDLHFDCGCAWPGFGGHSHCDIHTAGPPDCPWCDHPWTFGLVITLTYGAGLAAVLRIPRRKPLWLAVSVSLTVVLAGTMIAGFVTSLLTGRPFLAGL